MTPPRIYVYAVCAGKPDTAGLAGVSGGTVEALPCADLVAVVGEVPAGEFSTERIDDHLQDLEWLARTARAHHDVVGAVGAQTAVVPLSLATVFHDRDRARQEMEARRDVLAAALGRVRGRSEWGLKLYRPAGPARESGGRRDRPASGSEYLRRRRAEVDAARSREDDADRAAAAVHDAVAAAAVDARRHRVHDESLTGRPEPMVLNAAYLVDDDRVADWRAAVEGAATGDLVMEVTGPWVPYSFAEAHGSGAAG